MKFGLSLFGYAPRFYADVARVAEDNGFESVWMSEHLVFPAEIPGTYPYSESGFPSVRSDTALFDPWVVFASIAEATQTIRLATNVYILPLRHPLVTGRSVVTLDRLSNGRVTLGVGVGWLEEEFDALGVSFKDRGRVTDEIIPLLRRLWTDEVIDHDGDYYRFGPVRFEPKPRQRPLPIHVGGGTPPALRRAGRLGDGWIEVGSRDLDDVREKLAVLERHRREAGRSDLQFEVTLNGPYARALDDLRRCEELGVTRVIVAADPVDGHLSPETTAEWTKRYADEVVSLFG
jgi:probable F420-dependent oxidoreductase